jgi:hypothetical protein
MLNQPAGWYRDPDSPSTHLYWNGESWGEPLAGAPEPRLATDEAPPGGVPAQSQSR